MDKNVSQYCTDALRLCGQLPYPGGGPSPDAIQECSGFFNQLLDGWNVMRNKIYAIADIQYTLTPGQVQYTIGPTGDLNGQRPQKITNANIIYATSPTVERLPLAIIDTDQWFALRLPELQSAIPQRLYFDNGYSQSSPTGLGTIWLWPAPQSNYILELGIWQTLNSALLPTDTLYAPPGYARALTYSFAEEILPLYPKRVTPEREAQIGRIAMEARGVHLDHERTEPDHPD